MAKFVATTVLPSPGQALVIAMARLFLSEYKTEASVARNDSAIGERLRSQLASSGISESAAASPPGASCEPLPRSAKTLISFSGLT